MTLPLFPLHAVLFPGASLPLQVFEPRYRSMMQEVLDTDRRLGIAAIRRGMEVGGPAETYAVGCTAEVTQIQRAPSGVMQIVVEGRARFRIDERLPDDPFPAAKVTMLEDIEGDVSSEVLADARAAVRRYLSVVAQLNGEDVVVPSIPQDVVAASFAIAATLQLDVPARQELLAARDAAQRLRTAAEFAKHEALLLEALGPSVGRPRGTLSLN